VRAGEGGCFLKTQFHAGRLTFLQKNNGAEGGT
jgi:hypothetical protein